MKRQSKNPVRVRFNRTDKAIASIRDMGVREALVSLMRGAKHYASKGAVQELAGCLDSVFCTAFVMHRTISDRRAVSVMRAVAEDIGMPASGSKPKRRAAKTSLTALHAATSFKWTHNAMCGGTIKNPAPHCIPSHYNSCFDPEDGTGCAHTTDGGGVGGGGVEILHPWE